MIGRFKIWVFAASFIFYIGLTIISFAFAMSMDDGRGLSATGQFIARLFFILRYPGFLIWHQDLSIATSLLALGMNGLLYALVTERIIALQGFLWKVKKG